MQGFMILVILYDVDISPGFLSYDSRSFCHHQDTRNFIVGQSANIFWSLTYDASFEVFKVSLQIMVLVMSSCLLVSVYHYSGVSLHLQVQSEYGKETVGCKGGGHSSIVGGGPV